MRSNIVKILKKEIRETLRDKKSLLMMIVIPLLIPLIVIGFSAFFDTSVNKDVIEYNKIGFSYELSDEEKIIVKELEIEPIIIEDETELKEVYDKGEIDLYITKENNKYILNGVNNETTAYASTLAESYFEVYKQYLQIEYLENNYGPDKKAIIVLFFIAFLNSIIIFTSIVDKFGIFNKSSSFILLSFLLPSFFFLSFSSA